MKGNWISQTGDVGLANEPAIQLSISPQKPDISWKRKGGGREGVETLPWRLQWRGVGTSNLEAQSHV